MQRCMGPRCVWSGLHTKRMLLAIECGGKRSATPLFLAFPCEFQEWGRHPKRRRASLAAALHITIPVMGCIRRIRSTSPRRNGAPLDMFPLSQRMFPPRLNDGTVHEAKVCVVRVAYETNDTGYGVRQQAQRDAALDGVPLL